MPLKIYNSLTHRKELFEPLVPNQVRMYVCGITAYDDCHVGHARAAVVFDVIYRYLLHKGFEVTYVRNFTDVDDKIIKKANESGSSSEAVAEKYIQSYSDAMRELGMKTPTVEPRASQHIQEMIELIKKLEVKGFAYQAGSDVIYPVRKLASYGKLSHKKIDELEAGARVEVDQKKKDPLDFVLWKGSKPGEPKWPSPWGEGRPGWHIECSAMSMKYLGESFDIHGGGRDLIFPHHENEIAQSEAATDKSFVRYWIHNGFVDIDFEKMSKSLGNIRTIPEILRRWSPEVVRLFLLSSHYRSPVNFTERSLDESGEALLRFYETMFRLKSAPVGGSPLPEIHLAATFEREMDDDFNVAKFLGVLFSRVRRLNSWLDRNRLVDDVTRRQLMAELEKVGAVLGIFGNDPQEFLAKRKRFHLQQTTLSEEVILGRIKDRERARAQKNWALADEIRKELASQGIELRDNPDGTTSWTVRSGKGP